MRVCHLTSAHPRFDTRIFLKECRSLAGAGYNTTLIVADGKGDEFCEGVSILDVGLPSGRLDRMRAATRRVLAKALTVDASIYHFHDPELIPVGLSLKKLGKCVIFDSHEDVPKQIKGKPYLNRFSRFVISRLFDLYEKFACPKFDAIVAATPFIRDKFFKINARSVDVNNFPMLGELEAESAWGEQKNSVCYVGGIAAIRGIREVVTAMGFVTSDVRLQLAGKFSERVVEQEVKGYEGWGRVDELGFVDRLGVRQILERSVAGIVTFLPSPNHIDAQPNKMFEYMSAGVPVIGSNFPLWEEIILGNDCGLCVDPTDSRAIAGAIDFLINNPERAKAMGENGRRAVYGQYNWDVEERKLLSLYEELVSGRG